MLNRRDFLKGVGCAAIAPVVGGCKTGARTFEGKKKWVCAKYLHWWDNDDSNPELLDFVYNPIDKSDRFNTRAEAAVAMANDYETTVASYDGTGATFASMEIENGLILKLKAWDREHQEYWKPEYRWELIEVI